MQSHPLSPTASKNPLGDPEATEHLFNRFIRADRQGLDDYRDGGFIRCTCGWLSSLWGSEREAVQEFRTHCERDRRR